MQGFEHRPLSYHRLRQGLEQTELGFLLGEMDGPNVCRHEHGQVPQLRIAFGYAMVLGVPVEEIFASERTRMKEIVVSRAEGLLRSIERKRSTPQREMTLKHLRDLLARMED